MTEKHICPSTMKPCSAKWCHGSELCPKFFGKEDYSVTITTTSEIKYKTTLIYSRRKNKDKG